MLIIHKIATSRHASLAAKGSLAPRNDQIDNYAKLSVTPEETGGFYFFSPVIILIDNKMEQCYIVTRKEVSHESNTYYTNPG